MITEAVELPVTQRRYVRVNATWPSTLPPLTGPEAISAAKRLYRQVMGKAFKGKFKVTSGRRRTWIRYDVWTVNPDQGWHDFVHDISHDLHGLRYPDKRPHDFRHSTVERELIETVISKGWLDGKLRRPAKTKEDVRVVRYQRLLRRAKAWQAKKKRAENALKKLARQTSYYERTLENVA